VLAEITTAPNCEVLGYVKFMAIRFAKSNRRAA